jgi:hypothetical protein
MSDLPDAEVLIEDCLVQLAGYYPHQMAQKIVEALRNAGFDMGPED